MPVGLPYLPPAGPFHLRAVAALRPAAIIVYAHGAARDGNLLRRFRNPVRICYHQSSRFSSAGATLSLGATQS